MARVIKCDFCSNIVEDENDIYDMDLAGDYFDLCESCYGNILALKNDKEV